ASRCSGAIVAATSYSSRISMQNERHVNARSRSRATALSHWHVIHAHGQLGSTNTSTPVTPASCCVARRRYTAVPSPRLQIDVFPAVVCAGCWLGKRRLERAREQLDFADEIEVRWRAFQLDPRAPVEPRPYTEVLARKYGPDAVPRITNRLGQLGRQEGLDYRWDRVQRVNSFDAHRLLAWAASRGTDSQNALAERLFHAYFTEGANGAARTTLAPAPGPAGP